MTKLVRIAVVGCGITGSTLTSQLLSRLSPTTTQIRIYDQGYRPGGRTSSRLLKFEGDDDLLVDHGCQFFRSDLPASRSIVDDWVEQGFVKKLDDIKSLSSPSSSSFFGFPNRPPFFYPTSGGMVGLVNKQVDAWPADSVVMSSSHRVTAVERDESSTKFKVTSTTGKNAIHDTADKDMAAAPPTETDEFDAVIFTDVSSTSFKSWHRASALGSSESGIPEEFLADVRSRLENSGRVPLFSCIVVFETPLELENGAEAVTFEDSEGAAWFACRSSAKLGQSGGSSKLDAWVIISTPKFGVDEISRVPMQTEDGKFIPQDKDYLREGPCQALLEDLKGLSSNPLPNVVCVDGQRWGSALPGVKVNGIEGGKKVCRDVLYDGAMQDLAPTVAYPEIGGDEGEKKSFVMHSSGLFQAGDMMAMTSPGVEGAIVSASECADAVIEFLTRD